MRGCDSTRVLTSPSRNFAKCRQICSCRVLVTSSSHLKMYNCDVCQVLLLYYMYNSGNPVFSVQWPWCTSVLIYFLYYKKGALPGVGAQSLILVLTNCKTLTDPAINYRHFTKPIWNTLNDFFADNKSTSHVANPQQVAVPTLRTSTASWEATRRDLLLKRDEDLSRLPRVNNSNRGRRFSQQ